MNDNVIVKIEFDVQKALGLIHELKKENAQLTVKQLEILLDQYILANMAHNTTEAKAILKKISDVIHAFIDHMQKADDLAVQLEDMQKHPGNHLNQDLAYLQTLIHQLKEDVASGNIPVPLESPCFCGVGFPPNLNPPPSLSFLSLAASAPLALIQIRRASLQNSGTFKWNGYMSH